MRLRLGLDAELLEADADHPRATGRSQALARGDLARIVQSDDSPVVLTEHALDLRADEHVDPLVDERLAGQLAEREQPVEGPRRG
jgi:hypothetical protein